MIAGFEEPTRGDIYIGGTHVNDVEPKQRDCRRWSSQSYALYPHKTGAGEHRVPAEGAQGREGAARREAAAAAAHST
jgi:ABC-type sugar transport system ATPase subunit